VIAQQFAHPRGLVGYLVGMSMARAAHARNGSADTHRLAADCERELGPDHATTLNERHKLAVAYIAGR
jgi:hypothetical protein